MIIRLLHQTMGQKQIQCNKPHMRSHVFNTQKTVHLNTHQKSPKATTVSVDSTTLYLDDDETPEAQPEPTPEPRANT